MQTRLTEKKRVEICNSNYCHQESDGDKLLSNVPFQYPVPSVYTITLGKSSTRSAATLLTDFVLAISGPDDFSSLTFVHSVHIFGNFFICSNFHSFMVKKKLNSSLTNGVVVSILYGLNTFWTKIPNQKNVSPLHVDQILCSRATTSHWLSNREDIFYLKPHF